MILSSINFLKPSSKPKLETDRQFTDFIIEKIKEEQDRRDAGIGVSTVPSCKRSSKDMSSKDTQSKVSQCVQSQKSEVKEEAIVSIETGDGYYFSVHNMYNRLQLSDTESPNKNCIFRQKQIPVSENEGEKRKLMVAFHLNHDKTKYISVGTDKRIEISANSESLDPSNPDERFFVIHEIDNGMVFVQPYHHKGCYFHHMDNELTVSKFELNYRPPEEYFFKINRIEVLETAMSSASSMGSSVTTEEVSNSHVTGSHHHHPHQIKKSDNVMTAKSDNFVTRTSKQTHKPSLFLGCFGLLSKNDKRQKRKC